MIKITKGTAMNFENAIRGARNPLNSWNRMDSSTSSTGEFTLGHNDKDLAGRLIKAGSDHRKFMRQIIVSVDLSAPMYWWKEFDTYKVSTVANSTSTMHKITSKSFELSDFSSDHMNQEAINCLNDVIATLEKLRLQYLDSKDKAVWYSIIQLLPSSYNQLRTCTMSYETLRNMFFARGQHKLDEWHDLCDWIETLPYSAELITIQ